MNKKLILLSTLALVSGTQLNLEARKKSGPFNVFDAFFDDSFDDGANFFSQSPFVVMSKKSLPDLRADVFSKDNAFIIKIDVPGCKKENISLGLNRAENLLSVEIEEKTENRRHKKQNNDDGSVYFESSSWSSSSQRKQRSFPLPDNADLSEKPKSELENGVLTITVPLLKENNQKDNAAVEILDIDVK